MIPTTTFQLQAYSMSTATETTTAPGRATSPKAELEKALAHRPDREELVGRNILPSEFISLTSQLLSIGCMMRVF